MFISVIKGIDVASVLDICQLNRRSSGQASFSITVPNQKIAEIMYAPTNWPNGTVVRPFKVSTSSQSLGKPKKHGARGLRGRPRHNHSVTKQRPPWRHRSPQHHYDGAGYRQRAYIHPYDTDYHAWDRDYKRETYQDYSYNFEFSDDEYYCGHDAHKWF